MTPESLNRKLTAILSADAVGYSRLMANDEVETVQRLKSYRELIGTRVKEHHGRVVDSPGDNILAEFPSALDAVRSAMEIQQALKNRNADLPDDRKMQFRIGIHLGDVIVDGDRIYGDGVNIAARLEGLSDPSGICLSDMVHKQVKGKLDIEFEDIGLQTVKNIPEPVRVYRISIESKRSADRKKEKPVHVDPGKPSIAILPFVNMSNDPDNEYFSDGMAEEILNGLAKNPGLDVRARTSSFEFKDRNQDIREIGKMLNVTHIVEGSVRKSGNRIRLTAQLIKTDEDTHIWSERYDRELTDIFEIQDDIASAILNELNIRLLSSGQTRTQTTNMEAYSSYLLGRYQFYYFEVDDAVKSLEKAISLDPEYADAYGALVIAHNSYLGSGRASPQEKLPVLKKYINQALSLDSTQPEALTIRGVIHFFVDHDYQKAITEFADLVQRYPNNITVLLHNSNVFEAIGRYDLSLITTRRMVEVDPISPFVHLRHGMTLSRLRRLKEAQESFKRAQSLGIIWPMILAINAFYRDDKEELKKQLDLGQSNWFYTQAYPIMQAALSYFNGDHEKIKEIFDACSQDPSYTDFHKGQLAVFHGNLDLSLDYYAQALSVSSPNLYGALEEIQQPRFITKLFPEYRSHPKYQKMLRDVGLDEESIAKLKIPPLPF